MFRRKSELLYSLYLIIYAWCFVVDSDITYHVMWLHPLYVIRNKKQYKFSFMVYILWRKIRTDWFLGQLTLKAIGLFVKSFIKLVQHKLMLVKMSYKYTFVNIDKISMKYQWHEKSQGIILKMYHGPIETRYTTGKLSLYILSDGLPLI